MSEVILKVVHDMDEKYFDAYTGQDEKMDPGMIQMRQDIYLLMGIIYGLLVKEQ